MQNTHLHEGEIRSVIEGSSELFMVSSRRRSDILEHISNCGGCQHTVREVIDVIIESRFDTIDQQVKRRIKE